MTQNQTKFALPDYQCPTTIMLDDVAGWKRFQTISHVLFYIILTDLTIKLINDLIF